MCICVCVICARRGGVVVLMSEWLEEMSVWVYLCMYHICKKQGVCGAINDALKK